MKDVKETIYNMFIENTGKALCDSGDYYGRNYERNRELSLEDFLKSPEAVLEVSRFKGKLQFEVITSTFHRMIECLELDDICEKFNSKEVLDWDGDIHGVSLSGQAFLDSMGFEKLDSAWNTYNFDTNFDQVFQGQHLKLNDENYVLIQIHGGADVRGGYTNAKLFKTESEHSIFNDDALFHIGEHNEQPVVLDWFGEFINYDGCAADDEDFELIDKLIGKDITNDHKTAIRIEGSLRESGL